MRRIALGVAGFMIAAILSGCGEPPVITPTASPSTLPESISPIATPSVEPSEPYPNDDGFGDDGLGEDDLRPEDYDLHELSASGMSEDQVWTVETNLYSVYYGFNSDESDPAKYVMSYRVSDVVRQKTNAGGWVNNARLITNVGENELQITVQDESGWGMKILVDGEETL